MTDGSHPAPGDPTRPGGGSNQCARDPVRVKVLPQRVSEGFQKILCENSTTET